MPYRRLTSRESKRSHLNNRLNNRLDNHLHNHLDNLLDNHLRIHERGSSSRARLAGYLTLQESADRHVAAHSRVVRSGRFARSAGPRHRLQAVRARDHRAHQPLTCVCSRTTGQTFTLNSIDFTFILTNTPTVAPDYLGQSSG